MIIRAWINIILLFAFAYGSWGVLNETIPPYRINGFQFVLYMIAPWALLYGSVKAWHQCFIWRRMLAERQTPPVLSRGQYRAEKPPGRAGILERICTLLLLLAIAAILKQFSITLYRMVDRLNRWELFNASHGYKRTGSPCIKQVIIYPFWGKL